jgi:hypothetical protein
LIDKTTSLVVLLDFIRILHSFTMNVNVISPEDSEKAALASDALIKVFTLSIAKKQIIFDAIEKEDAEEGDIDEFLARLHEAAQKLEEEKAKLVRRRFEIHELYFPSAKSSSTSTGRTLGDSNEENRENLERPRERRYAMTHDYVEEEKELREISSMPKLREGKRTPYEVMRFCTEFEDWVQYAVPKEDKQKRYLLAAVPEKVKKALIKKKRNEISLQEMYIIVYEKVLGDNYVWCIRDDLEKNVSQHPNELIQDFSERLAMYLKALSIEEEGEKALEYLATKSRAEYREVWIPLKKKECVEYNKWLSKARKFESLPSFVQLKKQLTQKKCNKCGKDGHWTSEHVDFPRGGFRGRGFRGRGFGGREGGRGGRNNDVNNNDDSVPSSSTSSSSSSSSSNPPTPALAAQLKHDPKKWLENVVCHKCNKKGHIIKFCPNNSGRPLQGFHAKTSSEEFAEYEEACQFYYDTNYSRDLAAVLPNRSMKDPVMFPALVEGEEFMITHDSGSSYSSANTPVWESLKCEEHSLAEPIECEAIDSHSVPYQRFKWVVVEIDGQPPVKVQMFDNTNKSSERILLSDKDAQSLNMFVSNRPVSFPRKSKAPDQVWAEPKECIKEEECQKEEVELVKSIIGEQLRVNESIPSSARCSIPNCEFKIDLMDEEPVANRQYLYPECYKPEVRRQHKEWLADGRVEPFSRNNEGVNLYNNPLNPVPKVSGGVVEKGRARITEDLRGPNLKTREPKYIIPKTSEMMEKLAGYKYYAEIDLTHAFHQIPLHKDSQKVTGYTDPSGEQFIWTVMVEGLKGAAPHMQWIIDTALASVSHLCVKYIDNIVTGANTLEELAEKLCLILKALNKVNLRVNPAKCKWAMRKIKFMGLIIDGTTRSIDPVKVNAFQKMQRPRTGKQMDSLLGFTNFIRDFIPLYALVTGPLEKLRKEKHITNAMWKEEHETAFQTIKQILTSSPVLSSIDWTLDLFIATDASQYGVGAVLYQLNKDGSIRYIDFAAKSLNEAQANYPATKRELLGVIFALKRWRHFLLGKHFIIEVDNKALQFIATSKERMVLDWTDFLLEFDFTIKYKKGVLNVLPHHLSHLYENILIDECEDEKRGALLWNASKLKVDASSSDLVAKRMREFVKDVIRKIEPPVEEREKIVQEKHNEGHVGADLLFRTLFKEGFYWQSMYKDCEKVSKGCLECLRFNIGRVGFHPISTTSASLPMDHIAMDFIGPFNTSVNGFNYILLVVDVLTRFVWLRPVKSKTAEEVAWVLLCIFADFGAAKIIQSDTDSSFFNKVISALREFGGFEQRRIMKYFPQANGLPERYVQEVKRLLEKWLRGDWYAWDVKVPALQMTLNDRIISNSKSKAFSIMFARNMNGFEDFRATEGELPSFEELEERNERMLKIVFPTICEALEKEGEKRNLEENKKRKIAKRVKEFEIGDTVMKQVDVRDSSVAQRWEGPFCIMEADRAQKGFRLLNNMGKLVRGFIPAAKLRIVQYGEDRDLEGFKEIKAIKGHRGIMGNREYLVQWKQKAEDEWVHELDCDAYDIIRKYWVKKAELDATHAPEVQVIAEVQQDPVNQITRSGRRVQRRIPIDV